MAMLVVTTLLEAMPASPHSCVVAPSLYDLRGPREQSWRLPRHLVTTNTHLYETYVPPLGEEHDVIDR